MAGRRLQSRWLVAALLLLRKGTSGGISMTAGFNGVSERLGFRECSKDFLRLVLDRLGMAGKVAEGWLSLL